MQNNRNNRVNVKLPGCLKFTRLFKAAANLRL